MPATGKITQVIGSTFDAEFPEDQLPAIYNAIKVDSATDGGSAIKLVGEVQQHLGGGKVRAVALGGTDGLRRGVSVTDTGAAVTVPVGKETLGRVFNLLGDPIDNRGPVTTEQRRPIHREPPDGAGALILASEEAAIKHGLTPRARAVGMATAGVPPRIMGMGPEPATRKLLARAGLKLADIDLIELNEAFAAQGLAVMRQLGLADDAEHVNPHGGAIALGHPLGMSGARLAMTAVSALEQRDQKLAVATMCIGVGQGIAALLERV